MVRVHTVDKMAACGLRRCQRLQPYVYGLIISMMTKIVNSPEQWIDHQC